MNEEAKSRCAEFYDSFGVKEFLIPSLRQRRSELVETLISSGDEEARFRIKEIDRTLDEIERQAKGG